MNKLMKIPFYVPFFGVLISFALFLLGGDDPDIILLAIGLVLLHISGWIMAVKLFLGATGFFSAVLES